ncbi:hypothetical protein CFBP5507_16400 [Agrobacterium salinitolerans]|uniref:Uncharacterized protein n=1 Tax=Agrobacterium salinitolerans TaxID=1183413 RepID=A0A4Z1QMN3_9HYPH|nr:hypothetical protein [Agrobacterium salinitolerans]UYZ09282.1 hypothetical protein CFBP5507_16400 [Agrobacterium salinitolerans]
MTAPKQLKRRAWPGAFLRSLGHASWAAEQTASGITFHASRHQAPFSSWAGPAQITSTLGFTTIEVPLAGGRSARLAGVTPHDAAGFISAANEAFRAHFLKQFEAAQNELTALSEVIARLGQPRCYPAAWLLSPFLARATAMINALPGTIPDGVLSEEQQKLIETVRTFQESPEDARRTAIKRFIGSDLADMKGFFDTIEKNPLTPEQRGDFQLALSPRHRVRISPDPVVRPHVARRHRPCPHRSFRPAKFSGTR